MGTTPDDHDPGLPSSCGPNFAGTGFGGPGAGDRRPWYSTKRVGFGYRPQTWQGWAVRAFLAAFVITAGALAPNTAWFWVAVILTVLTPLAIIVVQRR